MATSKQIDELKDRYERAMHAVQSGVKMELELDAKEATERGEPPSVVADSSACSPKHLRVGINSMLVDSGAIAGLLIKKGIITEEEYLEALVGMAELEQQRHEHILSRRLGRTVKLG